MARKTKLTATQQALLDRLTKHNMSVTETREDGERYLRFDDGKKVPVRSFNCLRRRGDLQPISWNLAGDPFQWRPAGSEQIQTHVQQSLL